jgi:uncharacterized protein (DUF1810 family)
VSDPYRLQRFIDAQETIFGAVLSELGAGSKQSHWMWFIFPQLAGLGRSPTAQYFALASIGEARAYLAHPVLGSRLRNCTETLLTWANRRTAEQILGSVDALKLQSSLTLFEQVEPSGLFSLALAAFYEGTLDESTLALLNAQA